MSEDADEADEADDGAIHDAYCSDFLRRHIGACARAQADGADIKGYFVWSLMDNFEWEEGWGQRFSPSLREAERG